MNLDKIKKNNIMEDNKISIITCESGDWTILRYEDFERSGHRIELEDIEDLLKYLGYKVEYKEISDEEMEELN